jgi:hypothetical protein
MLGEIIGMLGQIGEYLQAQRVLQSALALACLKRNDHGAREVERSSIYGILGDGATVLAAIDRGETLWQIYSAIRKVESWWEPMIVDGAIDR